MNSRPFRRTKATAAIAAHVMVGAALSATVVVAPLAGQARCPWTLSEVQRIGSLDGDDALVGVNDLEIGPDGRVYVVQEPFVLSVSVFDRDGRPRREIGRAGSGPGEFSGWVSGVGFMGDTLWVSDFGALHFFGSDGREARQVGFSTLVAAEGSRISPGFPLADGTYLGHRVLTGDVSRFYLADRLSLARFSARGEIVDTIAMVPQRLPQQVDRGFRTHPLADAGDWDGDPLASPTPDGSAVVLLGDVREGARTASFDLLRIAIDGDTLLKRTIPYEPMAVTRAERAWLTDAYGAFFAGDNFSPSQRFPTSEAERERLRREARAAITFPEWHPPVRRILAGNDGSIWLLREGSYPELVDRWEVYDSNGVLEGTVVADVGDERPAPWQPRLRVFRATRDELWGTTLDALDVTYIHRYRVEKDCR